MVRVAGNCLLVLAAMVVSQLQVSHAEVPELQQRVERILADEGLTGIAWALISDAGSISVGSAGFSDQASGARFSAETRFHVGSLTKAVLATGVLSMAKEGLLDLDAPVQRYLPELPMDNPWAPGRPVTVRHLLDHTAGINDAYLWQMFSERAAPDLPLATAFPDPAQQLRIRSQPGSRFSYSNMGYTVLGMIIESVSGARYERYLDDGVVIQLGMSESTFGYTTQEGERADPSLAWGHVDGGERYAASPMFLRPAGQLTTTAGDLARFAQFLLSDGAVAGEALIDPEVMRARGRPAGTEAAKADLIAGYALGLGRRDRHGVIGYCHGGNIVGFAAMLCVYPEQNKAFAYSVNTDSETADYGRLDGLFIETLGVVPAAEPPSTEPVPDMVDWAGWYTFAPNRFQTFAYLDTVFGATRVSFAEESIRLTTLQRPERRLRPVGDRLYSAHDRATTSHVFYRGDDGAYRFSDGFQTYQKTSPIDLYAHWVSLTVGLLGVLWVLIAGCVVMVRQRLRLFKDPLAPAFLAAAALVLPAPLFATQSFMALGDVTPASIMLATVTLLLPVGMAMTAVRSIRRWRSSRVQRVNAVAALSVLQWCAVLAVSGLLPLRLWA
ncbi:MAG: serine hydrolase domain-containing protein [Pseudomonadota bacterium]